MSISTGTRKERNVQTRSNEALIEADKEYINSLKIFSEGSNSVAGLAGSPAQNSPRTPAGNYLAREGDSMIGPIAFGPPINFRIVIDTDNTIDIGPLNENAQYTSNIELDSIQPNSFVLDIIANAAFDGQILYIRTFGPSSFTISQGTVGNGGNIQTGDGADVTLSALQVMVLIFDEALIIGTNTGGTWRVVSLSSGGTSGIVFPIDFPEEADRGTVTTNQTIDFANNTRHSIAMTVGTATISLDFTNEPANKLAISSITMKQDATGGRTFTFVDTVVNSATIIAAFDALAATESISFVVEWERAVFTAYLKTGNIVSGGGGSGDVVGPASATDNAIVRFDSTTGKLIQNSGITINDSDSISGITGISATGAGVLITGIDTYDFFQAGQSIQNKADPNGGILYNANNVQAHIFRANSVEIARFAETAAGVYRLEMLDHSIRDARDITFDVAASYVAPGAVPSIGYDPSLATDSLRINVPAGAEVIVTNNNVIGSTIITSGQVESNLMTVQNLLQIGTISGGTPSSVSGSFANDGTDTFVFSGGSIRNLSNIGVSAGGADVFLSNLTSPTNINQDLLPQAGKSLGGTGNIWSAVHVNNLRLGTAGVVSPSDNQILGTSTGIDFNVPTASNFDFLVQNANVGSISSSGTLNFNAAILDTTLHLNNIGAFAGINGDIYLEGSDVKIFSGGIERNASDIGTGTFLPLAGGTMTGEIDMNNNDIVGIDDLRFNTANMNITSTSTILSISVPSGQTFRIRDGTTTRFIMTGSSIGIGGNSSLLRFFGGTAIAKPTVTGSRAGNVALTSLLTQLANLGLLTDSST